MDNNLIKWSAIAKELKIDVAKIYSFRSGANNLTKEQVKVVKAIIETDYKETISFLSNALKTAI